MWIPHKGCRPKNPRKIFKRVLRNIPTSLWTQNMTMKLFIILTTLLACEATFLRRGGHHLSFAMATLGSLDSRVKNKSRNRSSPAVYLAHKRLNNHFYKNIRFVYLHCTLCSWWTASSLVYTRHRRGGGEGRRKGTPTVFGYGKKKRTLHVFDFEEIFRQKEALGIPNIKKVDRHFIAW